MNYITNLYIFSLVFGMHPICENGLTVIVCCGAAEKSSNRVIAFYPVAWDFVFCPVLPSISRNAEILSHANKTRSSAVDRGEEDAAESC